MAKGFVTNKQSTDPNKMKHLMEILNKDVRQMREIYFGMVFHPYSRDSKTFRVNSNICGGITTRSVDLSQL